MNLMTCMGWHSHNYSFAFSTYIHISIGLWMNVSKFKRSERHTISFERKLTENNGNKSIRSEEQEKVDISSTDISSALNINS